MYKLIVFCLSFAGYAMRSEMVNISELWDKDTNRQKALGTGAVMQS